MDVDDQLGPRELGFQPFGFTLEPGDLSRLGVRLAPALGRGQAVEFTALPLLTPRRQMRRVQALAAQQCAHFARLSAGICGLEDAPLVLRGKAPPFGFGYDFGIGDDVDPPVV